MILHANRPLEARLQGSAVRGRRDRGGNRGWELCNRLTRSAARMYCSQLDPMIDDLMALAERIAHHADRWNAKEDLLDVLALARTHAARTDRLFRSGHPDL